MLSTFHNYLQCFFLLRQSFLNCTTFGITMQHSLVFFVKCKTFFEFVSFHLPLQSQNNGNFASEPLHIFTETNCNTLFFFEW